MIYINLLKCIKAQDRKLKILIGHLPYKILFDISLFKSLKHFEGRGFWSLKSFYNFISKCSNSLRTQCGWILHLAHFYKKNSLRLSRRFVGNRRARKTFCNQFNPFIKT